jgi:hypothetical protein
MRVFVLLLLCLSTSGCITLPRVSFSSTKEIARPNSVAVKPIEFKAIDLNEDGNISEGEVNKYNAIKLDQTPEQDLTTPVKAIIGIILLTLIVCLAVAVKYKKNKND